MPEEPEYQLMAEKVGPKVENMEVLKVEALGLPYLDSNMQKEHLNRIKQIPTPFTINKLKHHGKEFNLKTTSSLSCRITFCQGAYLYYIDNLKLLEFEPFKSEAYLGFFSSNSALLIIDVSIFRHQACVQFFNDGLLHWSNKKLPPTAQDALVTVGRYPRTKKDPKKPKKSVKQKQEKIPPTPRKQSKSKKAKQIIEKQSEQDSGPKPKEKQNVTLRSPCVVTQQAKFKEHFLRKLSANPFYFQVHSLAFIMYDDTVCYGLGEYTVSELLCRFYLSHQVKPWDNAYKSFVQVPGFLEAFLEGPRILAEEYKLYTDGYDPVLFRKAQRLARTEFRLNFRLVYGKYLYKDKPIISLFFKERKQSKSNSSKSNSSKSNSSKSNSSKNSVMKKRNIRSGSKSVWAFCFEEAEIPSEVSVRGGKEEVTASSEVIAKVAHQQDYSRFMYVDPSIKEDWFRYSGRIITRDLIGVGPHDWHLPFIAAQYAINNEKFDINRDKDPVINRKKDKDEKEKVKLTTEEILDKRKQKAEAKLKEPTKPTKRGGIKQKKK